GTDLERAAGLVRVHVDLQRLAVADDKERIAERYEPALDRVWIELGALDQERRAVAVARELLVDRFDPDLLQVCGRIRERLAGERRSDAAHELQQPCAAGIDDAG